MTEPATPKRTLTSQELSWILYDVANSAFALTVVTTVMPIFFSSVAEADGLTPQRATALWGYTNSVASVVLAVSAPVLGTLADYPGNKRRMFIGFFAVGLLMCVLFSTIGLGQWRYAMALSVLAFIGYAGANLFYDAFLPDVVQGDDPSRLDTISTYGYAWGYIGSILPFGVALVFILNPDLVGGTLNATRLSFIITAVWWAGFTIPMLRNVRQTHTIAPAPNPLRSTGRRLMGTLRHVRDNRNVLIFLLAYFFYIDGVGTIYKMAAIYGAEIGLEQSSLITAILVVQIVAFPFALLFGWLSAKVGPKTMLLVGICIYFVIVSIGFFIPVLPAGQQVPAFWGMAMLVGSAQGGIQALSRSFFGSLIPPERAGEFYGIYNIFGKFAAILGPLLLAIMADLTGASRYGVLSIAVLFFIGGVLLLFVRRDEPAVGVHTS
ncbi:MAG: MFS transporter [Myxococcota bacterium]